MYIRIYTYICILIRLILLFTHSYRRPTRLGVPLRRVKIPEGAVRAIPAGAARAIPEGPMRAIPGGAARAIPEGAVRAIPGGAVRAIPEEAVRVIPEGVWRRARPLRLAPLLLRSGVLLYRRGGSLYRGGARRSWRLSGGWKNCGWSMTVIDAFFFISTRLPCIHTHMSGWVGGCACGWVYVCMYTYIYIERERAESVAAERAGEERGQAGREWR